LETVRISPDNAERNNSLKVAVEKQTS